MTRKITIILIGILFLPFCGFSAQAEEPSEAFRSTPYPLPRFVTLRSDEVFVRSGPGKKFPIKWVLKKRGLPVEVILEYEVWRKVRDHEGDEGWVHQSLTSGKRAGVLRGDSLIPLYASAKDGSRLIARAESGSVGAIDECRNNFCRIELSGYKGWAPQNLIWGVYESESFK